MLIKRKNAIQNSSPAERSEFKVVQHLTYNLRDVPKFCRKHVAGCRSNTEFLAKLYCVRNALDILSTLVLAGLCAKKTILMHPDGFLSRFYSISETVAPLMAWGLLGPDSELKTSCVYFKDIILGFFRDMFSFMTARYTTVEALAEDIVTLAKQRFERAAEDLSSV